MGHAYNYGVVTSAKGFTTECIRLKCTDGSGTLIIDEDCGAGLISSVSRSSAGLYVLQLAVPYPPKVIQVSPTLAPASQTTATLTCRYLRGSYSATAGTLSIAVSNAAGTGATDPANGDEIHIDLNFRRYTANP